MTQGAKATTAPSPSPRRVAVLFERLEGWVDRFEARHADTSWSISGTRVAGASSDGTSVAFTLPFGPREGGAAGCRTLPEVYALLGRRWEIGIVVVRRGGFAVARLVGAETVDAKVGRRHVQGRTKAGGWSQQRFARRRDNQARVAFEAAAGHVERILLPHAASLSHIAVGGDRRAVETVMSGPSLAALGQVPRRWLEDIAGGKGGHVLGAAVAGARSVVVEIRDPI